MILYLRSSLSGLRPVFRCLVLGLAVTALGQETNVSQTATQPASSPSRSVAAHSAQLPGLYNPVADPKAVVRAGSARFTVLTPQLIRMEWAADGKFEDHASFVFLNRRLPVPKFQSGEAGGALTIKTDALEVRYHLATDDDGKFTA